MKVLYGFNIAIKKVEELLFRLLKMELTLENHLAFIQFVKFCFVGVSNAVVYYSVYAGSLILFKEYELFGELDYQVSQIMSFVVSVFWAFSINRKFVFHGSNTVDSYFKAMVKFYITYAFTGLFMNSVLLFIWKQVGISEFIGPFINILFTTPVNYLMSKKWTFKKRGKKQIVVNLNKCDRMLKLSVIRLI